MRGNTILVCKKSVQHWRYSQIQFYVPGMLGTHNLYSVARTLSGSGYLQTGKIERAVDNNSYQHLQK